MADITNTRSTRGDIAIEPMNIKRVIKEYYEQLYAYKCDDTDEMNKFSERHNVPKIVQEKNR